MKRLLKIKHFLVLIPLITLVITNLNSLDFGDHWDEETWQIKPIQTMLKTGTFLPFSYLYPSLCYWIGLKSTAPDFIALWGQGKSGVKQEVIERVGKKPFLLRLRAIYCLLGSLSIVLIYFTVYRRNKNLALALIAASIFGLSWEIAYHFRWVATDTLLVLAASLCLFFITKRQLLWAAMACGVATGAKYPGALLFIIVVVRSLTLKEPFKRLALYFGLMVATFVVTTPGCLIEPGKFLDSINYIRGYYGSKPHWGYNISAGIPYFIKIMEYLALYLLSPFWTVSLFLFLLVLVGAVSLCLDNRKEFFVLASFPVLYILYFSTQTVFIVRNFLVLTPFLVIFCAEGISFMVAKGNKRIFTALIAAVLVTHGIWLVLASESIRNHSWSQTLMEASDYVSRKKPVTFFLSPKLRKDLALPSTQVPLADAQFVLVAPSEVPRYEFWPANLRGRVTRTFGPQEINFNYYPSWPNDRIVLISPSQLAEINKEIPITEYLKK